MTTNILLWPMAIWIFSTIGFLLLGAITLFKVTSYRLSFVIYLILAISWFSILYLEGDASYSELQHQEITQKQYHMLQTNPLIACIKPELDQVMADKIISQGEYRHLENLLKDKTQQYDLALLTSDNHASINRSVCPLEERITTQFHSQP